jgi:hypothetical protein
MGSGEAKETEEGKEEKELTQRTLRKSTEGTGKIDESRSGTPQKAGPKGVRTRKSGPPEGGHYD